MLKKSDGFSLIEMLVVVSIIGILAMVGIPTYLGIQKRSARIEPSSNLPMIAALQEKYSSERGSYTPTTGAAGSTRAVATANLLAIQAQLPSFQPGPAATLSVSYRIIQNVQITNPGSVPWDGATAALTPCFVAVATGVEGTRLAGDIFAIDCRNNRNF